MQFDPIAILLDESGAGKPEEGIGMFDKGHNTPLMMSHVCSWRVVPCACTAGERLIHSHYWT